jgi:four helix bundle protein
MEHEFDHEKLMVYQVELQFISWVTPLIDEVRKSSGAKVSEVCDHLDRASLSFLLNTAEGNGKRQMRQRGRFFDDARGSGAECAACLDALVAKGACEPERTEEGKALLYRIVCMLTKLVQRFSRDDRVQETHGQYPDQQDQRNEDEHEHEHDDADQGKA